MDKLHSNAGWNRWSITYGLKFKFLFNYKFRTSQSSLNNVTFNSNWFFFYAIDNLWRYWPKGDFNHFTQFVIGVILLIGRRMDSRDSNSAARNKQIIEKAVSQCKKLMETPNTSTKPKINVNGLLCQCHVGRNETELCRRRRDEKK